MNTRKLIATALILFAPLASAEVVLSLDGQLVPLDSQLADITYFPSQSRLEINTQWDDLRCVLNPDGPAVTLPEPQLGDFVLALDYQPGDVMGEYVIEADGTIAQLLGAIAGNQVLLDIVTSEARINNCSGAQCAVLICTAGGTPVFSDDFDIPPPPQIDLVTSGAGNSAVVAGSGPNNAAVQISVANSSLNDASNLTLDLSQALPVGVSSGPVIPTVGSYNANNGEWTLPALSAGASANAILIYTVQAGAASGADVCVTGSVVSADQQIINPADDVHQQCVVVEREVDLRLLINNPSDPQSPGAVINYVIELETLGPSNASNVTVDIVQVLPSDVTLTNSFTSVGSFSNGTWTIGSVPVSPGATRTLNLFYTVGSAVPNGTQMQVSASVASSNETLINTADDSVSDTTSFTNP